VSDHRERLARNEESKSKAEHDREPWSTDEVEFLLEFFKDAKGEPEHEAEVAECLGRTIEACRQRFYEALRGRSKHVMVKRTTTTTSTTEVYQGLLDDPDDQWWSPDYYNN
jgi:hypothetical protein